MAPTPTIKRGGTGNMAIAEALNTLNSRIEKTENDFIGHLQKVETRLDQLVDLTKQFALLHQQSMQQTDQITELRAQFREAQTKNDASIARIHTRLDEVINHQRDKLELFTKEFEIKLDTRIAPIQRDIDAVSAKTNNVDSEFKKWFNRGWGAWAIVVLVFGAATGVSMKWIDSVDREKTQVVQTITNIEKVLDKNQIILEANTNKITELKQATSRIEQMNSDLDKQIDIIRSRK